jgi:hypothetical protein
MIPTDIITDLPASQRIQSPLLSRIGSYVTGSTLISPIANHDCGTHFGKYPTAPILFSVFTATNIHRVHHENVAGTHVLFWRFTLHSEIIQIDFLVFESYSWVYYIIETLKL